MIAIGESFSTETENCECTVEGLSCSPISACPEFRRMEGEATNPEAKLQCEELGGHIAFFKNEAEYNYFMSLGNNRREWLGKKDSNNESARDMI